jgi:hypothetical protein
MGMTLEESASLNKYLGSIQGKNLASSLFIDNLHCPYLEFNKEYILPSSSSVNGVDYLAADRYLQEISGFIPEMIRNMSVLPEPRPKKEIGKIFLIKELASVNEQKFLWILALDVSHLGGASNDKIITHSNQDRTPSLHTNRIYFSSKIVPIESLFYKEGIVQGFDTYEIKEILSDLIIGGGVDSIIKPYSEIFDEADFSKQERVILDLYNITDECWRIGNVYQPFGIDYLSLSYRSLEIESFRIDEVWRELGSIIWNPEFKKLSPSELEPLHRYLSTFHAQRELSPSGNLRWKISRKH